MYTRIVSSDGATVYAEGQSIVPVNFGSGQLRAMSDLPKGSYSGLKVQHKVSSGTGQLGRVGTDGHCGIVKAVEE